MRAVRLLVLLRLPLLVAMAASAALVVEYQNAGNPAFCGMNSGCMKVRMSPYSSIGGVPLPYLGLAAFALLFALSFMARTMAHHRVLAAMATAGAAAGVTLIYLQAYAVEAFCKWCMTVDSSAVLAAGVAIALALQFKPDGEAERALVALGKDTKTTFAWTLAGVLAFSLPFVWGRYPVIPAFPAELASYTVPGKVNVISFTDFQCPFCRKFHPALSQLRDDLKGRIHFTRVMVPLPGHPGAMPAALAWECAPEPLQDAMAHELYEAETQTLLHRTGEIAAKLGVDKDAFAACVADPATQAKVDHDLELFKAIDGAGLPLTYVGNRVVQGFSPERLQAARVAVDANPPELPVAAMWAVLAVAFVAAAALTLRRQMSGEAEAEVS